MNRLAMLFCASIAVGACAPEPQLASPAPQSGFAESYATELDSVLDDITEAETRAKKIIGEMPSFPEKLTGAPLDKALKVVDEADADGRSRTYVERFRQVEATYTFYSAAQDAIASKYADKAKTPESGGTDAPTGHRDKEKAAPPPARSPAKPHTDAPGTEAGGDAAASGSKSATAAPAPSQPATPADALAQAVDEQLKTALRERTEAQRVIERYRGALGEANVTALQKQADAIAYASYLVHVGLVESKVRLRTLLSEAQDVKKTANDFIASERVYEGEAGRTDSDKKDAEQRIDAMTQSAAKIDPALEKANVVERGIDRRIDARQEEYAQALAALRTKLGAPAPGKGAAEHPAAPPSSAPTAPAPASSDQQPPSPPPPATKSP